MVNKGRFFAGDKACVRFTTLPYNPILSSVSKYICPFKLTPEAYLCGAQVTPFLTADILPSDKNCMPKGAHTRSVYLNSLSRVWAINWGNCRVYSAVGLYKSFYFSPINCIVFQLIAQFRQFVPGRHPSPIEMKRKQPLLSFIEG